jgi:hypothetical protein
MNSKPTTARQTAEYKLLCEGFKEWLMLLQYSPLGIPAHTSAVKYFFVYQEMNGKTSLQQLQSTDANNFIVYLQTKTG